MTPRTLQGRLLSIELPGDDAAQRRVREVETASPRARNGQWPPVR
jgi:hypothetical protein